MFTDDTVTPVRLEILLDLLVSAARGLRREDVYRLLQPESLSDGNATFNQARTTIRAAIELRLAEESEGTISAVSALRKGRDSKAAILAAFDDVVLSGTEVEKYFALFFSYYLSLGKEVYERAQHNKDSWAAEFNREVFEGVPQQNPFNATKLTGLHRWWSYVGLGWYDPAEIFQANPYPRIERSLHRIFGRQRKLDSDSFMKLLANACPELDGGELFMQANRKWRSQDRQCTLGVSHALIELHLDEVLRLVCPADSAGWSIEDAEPPGGGDFKSARVASVEWICKDL